MGCCSGEKKEEMNGVDGKNGSIVATIDEHSGIKEYYGSVLNSTQDLLTSACTTGANMPAYVKPIASAIHEEVSKRYYGCGFCVPEVLNEASVLDLGSGTGRDVFILSKIVGEKGNVVGIDMTDNQLKVANDYIDYHTEKFGYKKSNVEFRKGYIEKLDEAGLADESFDVIVSNCVINLSSDKEAVLREAFRVLRCGGEMYFSDIYALRRVPDDVRKDPVLHGECIGGALYWNDFITVARKAGFADPRVVSSEPVAVLNGVLQKKVEGIPFVSTTVRLFKLENLEQTAEDYGVAVSYRGTIETSPKIFKFDRYYSFEVGRVMPVSMNLFDSLRGSRHAQHFEFYGDGEKHFGPFPEKPVSI